MKDKRLSEYCINIQKKIDSEGMTNEDLAVELGLVRETISRLVNGRTRIFLGTVQKIADYYGMDVVDLITGGSTPMLLRDSSRHFVNVEDMKKQYEEWLEAEKSKTREAERKLQGKDAEINAKREKISQLESTVATNKSTIDNLNSCIAFMKEEDGRKDAELSELRKELEELKSRSI